MFVRRCYYVYLMASRSGVLYVGMTNDLERRVREHKRKAVAGFTAAYNVNRLVYFKAVPTARDAAVAEKQIKSWRREKKVSLIESFNPTWRDLSEDWADGGRVLGLPPSTASPIAVTSTKVESPPSRDPSEQSSFGLTASDIPHGPYSSGPTP